jgi:hypothetical protein
VATAFHFWASVLLQAYCWTLMPSVVLPPSISRHLPLWAAVKVTTCWAIFRRAAASARIAAAAVAASRAASAAVPETVGVPGSPSAWTTVAVPARTATAAPAVRTARMIRDMWGSVSLAGTGLRRP